jgi:hypothetical protein
MKLDEEQLAAAADLLKRRIVSRGGPAAVRAQELCAGELKGWVTTEELLAAYQPDSAPQRWVAGEHERELDYYDPAVLAAKAPAAAEVPEREVPTGGVLDLAFLLGCLEADLIERKVAWKEVRYALRVGESWRAMEGAGVAQMADGARAEWLYGAVLIEREGAVVKVFREHRKKKVLGGGSGNSRRPVVVMERAELEVTELALKRLAVSVAALLLLLRRKPQGLESGASIARVAGMTRANVSAKLIKLKNALRAGGTADGKLCRGCGQELPLNHFYKAAGNARQSRCIACLKALRKKAS